MKSSLIALLLSLSCLFLQGQEEPPVTCHFLCFQRDAGNTAGLMVVVGDESINCPLPLELISKGIELTPRNGEIAFAKALGDKTLAAKARIPSGVRKALVMFIAAPATKAPLLYDTFVLDFSAKGFPEDGSTVVNLYAGDVRLGIGEHRILLKAGKTVGLARPKQLNDFNMTGVRIEFQQEDQWRVAADTTVRFPPHQQQLFIAFMDPVTHRPRLRTFLITSTNS